MRVLNSLKGSIEFPIVAALLLSPIAYGLFLKNREATSFEQQIQGNLEIDDAELTKYLINYNARVRNYREQIYNRIYVNNEDPYKVIFDCADNAPDTETKKMCLDMGLNLSKGLQEILSR